MTEKLQKILSRAGIASRRALEQMIEEGRVVVNGKTANVGDRFEANEITVKIDGKVVLSPDTNQVSCRVLMYHKPEGELTTLSDPENRPTVFDHIPKPPQGRWIYIGRLDINTSGALILTDDGEFANLVMHPSSSFEKTYKVVIDGQLTSRQAHQLEEGVMLEDGMTSKAKVEIILISQERSIFELTIHEGRNRQVRRMVEAIGHNTLKLSRVRIGPLSIKGIEVGKYIPIEESKIKEIKNLCLKNKRNNSYKKIAK